MDPRGPTVMTENRGCFRQVGVGIGCVFGTGIIALVLLWIFTVVLDLIGVVV